MKSSNQLPEIIQGGMGIGVSCWHLAKAVAVQGQMGVVSGTAVDSVMLRRLQSGDSDGNIRRALSHFPWADMAQRISDEYFIPGGKPPEKPFKPTPAHTLQMKQHACELLTVSNFVEVFLAKEGHNNLIGINYLEKIQLPTLPSLFGAMLAGVDFVLMGGGIPLSIPGVLDGLSRLDTVELKIHVEDNPGHRSYSHVFDPKAFCTGTLPKLTRPKFLAIISSDIAAKTLVRRSTGFVDGFVVEDHTAGGHNAPPRRAERTETPQFGQKDIPDIEKIRELGRPFWLAGGCASPEKLRQALDSGAEGIQVGTAFALCNESAMVPEIKQKVLRQCLSGNIRVFTDFQASPTGYPFKVISLKNTVTDPDCYRERKRCCDLGYLRQSYCKSESEIAYRCPGEPVKSWLMKGGSQDKTVGKHCLCNGLLATIGLGQMRENGSEPPVVTSGEDFSFAGHLVRNPDELNYSAKDVIDYIKS